MLLSRGRWQRKRQMAHPDRKANKSPALLPEEFSASES